MILIFSSEKDKKFMNVVLRELCKILWWVVNSVANLKHFNSFPFSRKVAKGLLGRESICKQLFSVVTHTGIITQNVVIFNGAYDIRLPCLENYSCWSRVGKYEENIEKKRKGIAFFYCSCRKLRKNVYFSIKFSTGLFWKKI